MKKTLFFILIVSVLIFAQSACGQWTSDWTSGANVSGVASGWLSFQLVADQWQYRYYVLDTVSFRVMSGAYSSTAQYTYTFSPAERLAGETIYSLGVDLTGDGVVEFYVLADYGTATAYRQAFRIINIVNNTTLLVRDDPSDSYTYPSIFDVDGDGHYECVFERYNYPALTTYYDEVLDTGVPTAAVGSPRPLPTRISLGQNWPNPFNPSTNIEYDLPQAGRVQIEVFDLIGQRVQTLVSGEQTGGHHSIVWNGTDGSGVPLSTGPYFYRLQLNGQPVQTKKMLLLK